MKIMARALFPSSDGCHPDKCAVTLENIPKERIV